MAPSDKSYKWKPLTTSSWWPSNSALQEESSLVPGCGKCKSAAQNGQATRPIILGLFVAPGSQEITLLCRPVFKLPPGLEGPWRWKGCLLCCVCRISWIQSMELKIGSHDRRTYLLSENITTESSGTGGLPSAIWCLFPEASQTTHLHLQGLT